MWQGACHLIRLTILIIAVSACDHDSHAPPVDDNNQIPIVENPIAAENLLQGAPQSLAILSIPEYFPDPAVPADFEVATANGLVAGLMIHPSRIIVKINPNSTVAEVNELLQTIPAIIAGRATSGIVYVELTGNPTQQDLVTAIATLEASPVIEVAVEDVLADTLEAGETVTVLATADTARCDQAPRPSSWTGTYFGGEGDRRWDKANVSGNWWIEFIRMPAVWNFNDAINRRAQAQGQSPDDLEPPVGVIDAGFQAHIDLPLVLNNRSHVSCHGNMVSGVIAARHDKHGDVDGEKGIEGIHPYARIMDSAMSLQMAEKIKAMGDELLPDQVAVVKPEMMLLTSSLANMLEKHRNLRVINYSAGFPWERCLRNGSCAHPDADPQAAVLLGKYARLSWEIIKNHPNVLIVTAAGNSNDLSLSNLWQDLSAKWVSPLNYLALEGIQDGDGNHVRADNVLVVENVSWQSTGGRRRKSSNSGGQLGAPGTCMTTTGLDNAYASSTGTSFSAPVVTGLAAYLWSVDPRMSVADVKAAILNTANLPGDVVDAFDMGVHWPSSCELNLEHFNIVESAQPPIVDAFAAAMTIDRAVEMLVDADDGTVDGVTVTGAGANVNLHGDGQIDMADFRAFRDAVAQQRLLDLEQPNHAKRDNNRDGCVYDGITCTVREEIWSRFDFNGDGKLSDIDMAPLRLPGEDRNAPAQYRSDLDVLKAVWPASTVDWNLHCANENNPLSEGWCAEDLQALLDSRDVIVDFSSFAPVQNEKIIVGLRIGNYGTSREIYFDANAEPRVVFTVPYDTECVIPVPAGTYSSCNNFMIYFIANTASVARAGSVNLYGSGATAEFHQYDRATDVPVTLNPDVVINLDSLTGTATESVMTATASYTDAVELINAESGTRRDFFSVTRDDGCISSCVTFLEHTRSDTGLTYRFTPTVAGMHTLHFKLNTPYCEEPDGICATLPFLPWTMQLAFNVGESTQPPPEPPPPDDPPPVPPLPPYPDEPGLPARLSWNILDTILYTSETFCDEAAGTYTSTISGSRFKMPTRPDPSWTENFSESFSHSVSTCYGVHGRHRTYTSGGYFYAISRDSIYGGVYPDKTVHSKTVVRGQRAKCPVPEFGTPAEEYKEQCYDREWRVGRNSDGTTYGYYEFSMPDDNYPAYPDYPF